MADHLLTWLARLSAIVGFALALGAPQAPTQVAQGTALAPLQDVLSAHVTAPSEQKPPTPPAPDPKPEPKPEPPKPIVKPPIRWCKQLQGADVGSDHYVCPCMYHIDGSASSSVMCRYYPPVDPRD
jgi:hypothetical protein